MLSFEVQIIGKNKDEYIYFLLPSAFASLPLLSFD